MKAAASKLNRHKRAQRRSHPFRDVWSSQTRTAVLGAFLMAVFLTGGSSRADMQSLALLRPISLLVLGYGMLTLSRDHVRKYRPLVVIALAAAALTMLHLLPLPPEIWHRFPGRETIARIDGLLDLHDSWRPLTLDSQATRNALMALVAPCAVLVLGIQLGAREHEALLGFVLGLGALTAVWGLLQLLGGSRGPFYLYSLTNHGFPVGLFANRNHQGVFLASLFPLMYCWTHLAPGSWRDLGSNKGRRSAMVVAGALLLVPLILITGSRAGLLALVLSICATATMMAIVSAADRRQRRRRPSSTLARMAPPVIGISVVAVLALATISLGRDRAFGRLIGSDPIANMRVDLAPITWRIAGENFPWGTGMGTFDDVYRVYEPNTLLMPEYVNHAHNDFLEVFMTGGMGGALIITFAIAIFAARAWAIARGGRAAASGNVWPAAALIALGILFIASLIDYPLRVPAMASYAVLLAIWASKGSSVADPPPPEYGSRRTKADQHLEQSS